MMVPLSSTSAQMLLSEEWTKKFMVSLLIHFHHSTLSHTVKSHSFQMDLIHQPMKEPLSLLRIQTLLREILMVMFMVSFMITSLH